MWTRKSKAPISNSYSECGSHWCVHPERRASPTVTIIDGLLAVAASRRYAGENRKSIPRKVGSTRSQTRRSRSTGGSRPSTAGTADRRYSHPGRPLDPDLGPPLEFLPPRASARTSGRTWPPRTTLGPRLDQREESSSYVLLGATLAARTFGDNTTPATLSRTVGLEPAASQAVTTGGPSPAARDSGAGGHAESGGRQ